MLGVMLEHHQKKANGVTFELKGAIIANRMA